MSFGYHVVNDRTRHRPMCVLSGISALSQRDMYNVFYDFKGLVNGYHNYIVIVVIQISGYWLILVMLFVGPFTF